MKKIKAKPKMIGQKVEVTNAKIEVLGKYDVVEMDDPSQWIVRVDNRVCTPGLSKVILKGLGWI